MGKSETTRQQKIDWLLANQALWEGWPNRRDEETQVSWDTRTTMIVRRMRAAGLYSDSTSEVDIRILLNNLIHDARVLRRFGRKSPEFTKPSSLHTMKGKED